MHRWYKALRCKDKSVLETLICQNKTSAREASQVTLETQTEGTSITANRVICQQSADNAIKSAMALVPFVDRKAKDVPTWVAFSARDAPDKCAIGLGRVPDESRNTVMHACKQPPVAVAIDQSTGIGALWSVATQELTSKRNDEPYAAVGVLERYAMIAKNRAESEGPKGVYKTPFAGAALARTSCLERFIADETMRALPSAPGGLTRSFLSFRTLLTVHELTFESGHELAFEGAELYKQATAMHGGRHETDRLTTQTLGTRAEHAKRIEPYCTPATRLAVGLRLNELLRRFMQGRSRKNEPCKVLLGYHTNAEVGRDVPPVMDTEPFPLATITDFNIRVDTKHGERAIPESARIPCKHVPASIALHVCLDGAIRAPEMIASLGNELQKRALLFVASSQASYVGDVGVAISAAAANANINSSKKISVRVLTHYSPLCVDVPHSADLYCLFRARSAPISTRGRDSQCGTRGVVASPIFTGALRTRPTRDATARSSIQVSQAQVRAHSHLARASCTLILEPSVRKLTLSVFLVYLSRSFRPLLPL